MEIKGPTAEMDQVLPSFRADLELYPGPDEPDGSPTYNIYDPLTGGFFKIRWAESIILKLLRPGITLRGLLESIERNSTLEATKEDIRVFFEDAVTSNLLSQPQQGKALNEEWEDKKDHPIKWLIFNYLYLRVHLVNPDKFLTKTEPIVSLLFCRTTMILYGIISVVGVILLLARLPEFINTFSYFFNPMGIFLFICTISGVKVIHELSHAYVAKHQGVRVPSIGAAFIVMWPVLYTDVTDAWKLKEWQKRFGISAAGVGAESVLAGLSTVGWIISPPGPLQSMFFLIASTTWVSTLLVNINPCMRFDGYYMLSDVWRIDNLQQRAFSTCRWFLRKMFLGFDVPPPEVGMPRSRMAGLIIYSLATWAWRLALYVTITAFIYYQFTKALGVILFGVAIYLFLVSPIIAEFHRQRRLKAAINMNKRLLFTNTVLALILFWFIAPLPHMENLPAISVPKDQQVVYVPESGVVEALLVEREEQVQAGQEIVRLSSFRLNNVLQEKQVEQEIITLQLQILQNSDAGQSLILQKRAERDSIIEQITALEERQKQMTITAAMDGTVYEWDSLIEEGQSVAKDAILGKVAPLQELQIRGFVPEKLVRELEVGMEVDFFSMGLAEDARGRIISINPVNVTKLKYDQLASINGGDIAVSQQSTEELILIDSYYSVEVELEGGTPEDLRIGQTGQIRYQGPWKSYLMGILSDVTAIFWRESTF